MKNQTNHQPGKKQMTTQNYIYIYIHAAEWAIAHANTQIMADGLKINCWQGMHELAALQAMDYIEKWSWAINLIN